jgi:uncharacterized protein (TIGR03437 family)
LQVSQVLVSLSFPALLAASQSTIPNLLSKTPLRFESDDHGGFLARDRGYRLVLNQSGLDLNWGAGVLRMCFTNANPRAAARGIGALPSYTNYFVGRDPTRWRAGVPNYERVLLRHIYSGIDLVLYGSKGSMEFDFDLAAGADPDAISMDVSGADRISVEDGALVLDTGGGRVRWSKPVVYQTEQGGRRSVAGRWAVGARGRIAFKLGAYDRTRPLVIDPVLSFSTYFGNTSNEAARGIAVDASGNIYIAGYATSRNLPVSANAVQAAYGGDTMAYQTGDAFVAKFTPAGALSAMTYIGGSRDDAAGSLALDSAGNVHITGYTNSLDFPVTSKAYQPKMAGMGGNTLFPGGDVFVMKLNPSLTQIVYSTYLGGSRDEAAVAIAVDSAGAAYVAGVTLSTNFPVTAGAVQGSFHGQGGQPITDFGVPFFITGDAFVSKLSADGSQLVFSTYLGGAADDAATTIAVDGGGNVYVGGFTISRDFPTSANALQKTYKGAEPQNQFYHLGDGFISKLNPTGTALLYSTYLGGAGDDAVTAIVVDASGSVYATGASTSTDIPMTTGTIQTANAGPLILPFAERIVGDAFAVKLKPDGSGLVFGTFLGGSGDDCGRAIAVDAAGNVYVAGNAASGNFPLTADATQRVYAGAGGEHRNNDLMGDGFLVVLNPTATKEVFGTFLGGSLDDSIEGLALDPAGNIYVTGVTMSTNFPVGTGAYQSRYGGVGATGRIYGDAFVARLTGPTFGTLTAAPASVSVNYTVGAANPAPTALSVTSSVPASFTIAKAAGSGTANVNWLTVSPNQGSTPSNLTLTVDPAGLAPGTYNATVTISAAGPGISAVAIPVTLTVAAAQVLPVITSDGVVNAASLLPGPIAPGEVLLITGSNFGTNAMVTAQVTDAGTLPTLVSGMQVLFANVAAPIVSTGAGQITAIVPYEIAGQDSVQMQVVYNGLQSAPVALQVTASSTALFTVSGQGTGQASALNADGTPNSADNPAAVGTTIQLTATGEGLIDPAVADGTQINSGQSPTPVLRVSVTIGGQSAIVQSAGTAAGTIAGYLQLQVVVPDGLPSGDAPVVLTIGDNSSRDGVTVAIQ